MGPGDPNNQSLGLKTVLTVHYLEISAARMILIVDIHESATFRFEDLQTNCPLFRLKQLAVHIAGTVLLAVFINVWIIIPAILLAVALLGARLYYIRACRELKRLEAIGKSMQLQ